MIRPLDEWFNVAGIEVSGTYALTITFDDGFVRDIDFSPVLLDKRLGELRDPAIFRKVKVNVDTGTIEWPNGVDFNPVVLHDWPVYEAGIIERLAHAQILVAAQNQTESEPVHITNQEFS